MNTSTAYTLNIEYEQHTTTATAGSYSFDHSYSIIIVDISVMVNSYESTLSSIRVGNFPFWVDTSDWTEGETVSISGNLYSIHSQTGKWRAYRSFADFESENLYYHKELGILIESNTDRISSGLSGFSGFSVEINIQHSNIDGFVARVTGSNIVGNIVLLSAIFTEVLIVRWLYTRKHKSRTTKSSK
jgi:3D (Asp-Asp-Asp) domain-containing protein